MRSQDRDMQQGAPVGLGGILNENAFHWTRHNADVYYNPDNITLPTYELMYNTDETVFSGIEFLTMAAIARLGEYTNEDEEKEDFVKAELARVPGGFPAKVADVMTACPFGFSLTEIVWRLKGRRVGLADLQTLHPSTLHLDLHRSGPLKNRPRVAYQFFRGEKQTVIPLNKAILYSHGATFGNAYGVSRLKRAYKSWFIKDLILQAWGLCCERYGTPYMVGKASAQGQVQINGKQRNAIDHMMDVMDSMAGGQGSAVIGREDIIEIIYAASGYGQDFEALVAYCNKMIYRALGLPSLIADHGNTGSYSLGKQHFKLFILVLEKILFEVIDVLIEQLVRPLIEMNFGPQEDCGTFNVEEFEEEDAKVLAETAQILTQTGYMSAEKLDDVNAVRERQGLPLWEEEDIAPSAPPTIKGYDPEAEIDPSTAEPIEEARERRGSVHNFSHRERTRDSRRAKKARQQRRVTHAELDRMAAQLEKFARPA